MLSYTLYSDRTELFVEFEPLVVGTERRFAAHFTAIGDSFVPIDTGTVTLTLEGSTGRQSITAGHPEVPGIFRLLLRAETAGVYDLAFDIRTPAYTDRIVIRDITVYATESAAQEATEEEPSAGNTISYLKEQAWNIDFANQPVHRAPFYDIVKTSGYIASAPGAEQTIAAKTPGIISFRNRSLIVGSQVHAGERLFTVSSEGFTDTNIPLRLAEAKATLDKAEADYARLEQLLIEQLTTQSEFLEARSEYERARAVHSSLSDTYGGGGHSITTTQTGVIKALLVTPGQYVEAGQPLAVISRYQRLTVKAELSQTAFSRVSHISSANFRVGQDRVYSLGDLNGKVLSATVLAGDSPFIPVWFEIDNREGLIPGTYLEVFIHGPVIENALVIPVSALMEEQGNSYCYVQVAGETFEKRQLILGGNDGRIVQVLSGVSEGERIVTRGAYNIKLSAISGALPEHGHSH
jgi:RND family efflux transporter MFP subunit